MEKLVGEIARLIYAEGGPSGITARKMAIKFVTRIGKAYADGEMKIPGEVGRVLLDGLKGLANPEAAMMNWINQKAREGAAFLIAIALRKEEDFEEFIMRETEAAMEGGIIDENTGLPFELEGTDKEEA